MKPKYWSCEAKGLSVVLYIWTDRIRFLKCWRRISEVSAHSKTLQVICDYLLDDICWVYTVLEPILGEIYVIARNINTKFDQFSYHSVESNSVCSIIIIHLVINWAVKIEEQIIPWCCEIIFVSMLTYSTTNQLLCHYHWPMVHQILTKLGQVRSEEWVQVRHNHQT